MRDSRRLALAPALSSIGPAFSAGSAWPERWRAERQRHEPRLRFAAGDLRATRAGRGPGPFGHNIK